MNAQITRADGLPIDALAEQYTTEQAQAWWAGMAYGEQLGHVSGWRAGVCYGIFFGVLIGLAAVKLGLKVGAA